jgi:hypothetical protein
VCKEGWLASLRVREYHAAEICFVHVRRSVDVRWRELTSRMLVEL